MATTRVKAALLRASIAALASIAATANASVVFSNLGSTDSYDQVRGNTVDNNYFPDHKVDVAAAFHAAGAAFRLTRIELAIGLAYGANELDIAVAESNGGFPSTIVESFHLSNAMGTFGLLNPLVSINSLLNPVLEDGKEYWLIATTSGSGTSAGWNHAMVSELEPQASRVNGSSWYYTSPPRGAFRISGDAVVPEPDTFALVALALALLAAPGIVKQRRR